MSKRSTQNLQYLGATNSLDLDADGWALIPFGDVKHSGRDARSGTRDLVNAKDPSKPKGIIQRFDRAAAEEIVADFKAGWGRLKRAVTGLPLFKGHPDAPRFSAMYPDKEERGMIADMEVANEGLRWRPVLNARGERDVGSGYSEYSPYWLLEQVGEENGMKILSPFALKSIGLVTKGNIPGLSLVNAAEDDDLASMNHKNHIIKLLAAMGKPVAADATDEAIGQAVEEACPTIAAANAAEVQLPALKTEKETLAAKLTTTEAAKSALEGEKIALVNAKETAEGEVKNLRAQLAAERKERAVLLANAAITDGRLTAADRDATVTALCNAADFAAEAAKLASKTKVVSTASTTADLGKQRDKRGSAVTVHELVNARMKEKGESYDTAYASVQNDPKHAELFQGMKGPKVNYRRS